MWLLYNLVSTFAVGNFLTVIYLQTDFLPKVQLIIRIVSDNRHAPTIDKAIQLQRSTQIDDLLHDLLHLAIRQRTFIQAVSLPIIIEQNIRPVFKQIRLRWMTDYFRFPATLYQDAYDGFFKISLFIKNHVRHLLLHKHFLHARTLYMLYLLQLFLLNLDKSIHLTEIFTDLLLFLYCRRNIGPLFQKCFRLQCPELLDCALHTP